MLKLGRLISIWHLARSTLVLVFVLCFCLGFASQSNENSNNNTLDTLNLALNGKDLFEILEWGRTTKRHKTTKSITITSTISSTETTSSHNPNSTSPYDKQVCLDNSTLSIDRLRSQQEEYTKFYRDLCGLTFVQLTKLNHSQVSLVFNSIIDSKTNKTTFEWIKNTSSYIDFNYRLVLRVYFPQLQDRLIVKVDSKKYTIKRSYFKYKRLKATMGDVTEFMIPTLFPSNKIPTVEVDNKSQSLISESYVVLCLKKGEYHSSCEISVNHNTIDCYCLKPISKSYIFVVVMLVLQALGFVIVLTISTGELPPNEPEVQFNFILCMPGHCSHEYLVIFRVGPSTDGFDYEKTYIDFQLLGPQDDPIGIPIRFSCKNFPDRLCGEMHMLIGRITPMPEVVGVKANHSDPNNVIFFYNFSVVDLRDNNYIIQEGLINQYIMYDLKVFRPKIESSNSDEPESKLNIKYLPFSTALRLNLYELTCLSIFLAAFVACVVMAVKRYLKLYHYWHNFGLCVAQLFIIIIMVSLISWIVIFLIEFNYKYAIKRNYLKEVYIQLTSNVPRYLYKTIQIIFIYLLYLISLALAIGTVFIGLPLNYIDILIWCGIDLIVLAIVFGVWICLQSYPIDYMDQIRLLVQKPSEQCLVSVSDDHLVVHSSERSSFINLPQSMIKPSTITNCSSFEPKMVNPNLPKNMENSAAYAQYLKTRKKGKRDSFSGQLVSKSSNQSHRNRISSTKSRFGNNNNNRSSKQSVNSGAVVTGGTSDRNINTSDSKMSLKPNNSSSKNVSSSKGSFVKRNVTLAPSTNNISSSNTKISKAKQSVSKASLTHANANKQPQSHAKLKT